MKNTIMFSVLFVLSALAVFGLEQLPVAIEQAEIDSTDIFTSGNNQLNVERGEEFTLRLELFSKESIKDVEFRAFVSGYEFNDVKPINDRIGPFDFDANVTYVKKMKLSLPDDVDVDDYQLRVVLSDRNSREKIYNYALQVDTKRHDLNIKDVSLSPGSALKAGQALLVTVRLENQGQKDENNIKVVVALPSLGVLGSEYVDKIKSDKEEETEEVFLKLPKCAEPGVYDITVDAIFNKGHDKVSKAGRITVLENEACKPEPAPVVVQQPVQNLSVVADSGVGKIRGALEVVLLVLVALLVVVGLVIGFTRMRSEE